MTTQELAEAMHEVLKRCSWSTYTPANIVAADAGCFDLAAIRRAVPMLAKMPGVRVHGRGATADCLYRVGAL